MKKNENRTGRVRIQPSRNMPVNVHGDPNGKYDLKVDLWGDFACFTADGLTAERYSSPVPTPSAIRGALQSIYGKPLEFWWQVKRIEVMNPIKYLPIFKNETTEVMSPNKPYIDTAASRTQRMNVYLKDVRYRVTAEPIAHPGFDPDAIFEQAESRVRNGQCFRQPYLGLRECTCYFEPADMSAEPIHETMNFNYMLYDPHVPYTRTYEDSMAKGKNGLCRSMYACQMVNGVIEVPPYASDGVLKIDPC